MLVRGAGSAAEEEPGFRRFADTISPDGAYVLAWGWGEEEHPEKLREWPPGQDIAGDFVANYLVDAVQGKVLATIPERDHYAGTQGFKRFSGLAVSWSEDSRQALAIYEGRWSDEAILWIRPATHTFLDVSGSLHKAYSQFLARKEKLADAGEISFSMPALLPGGVLIIDARARPKVNEPPEYNYRLKFRMKIESGKAGFTLVSGRKIPEPPEDDKVEKELNVVYQKLRDKLNHAGRAALKEKQLRWLKQREALGDQSRFFTRMRTAYLRALVEN